MQIKIIQCNFHVLNWCTVTEKKKGSNVCEGVEEMGTISTEISGPLGAVVSNLKNLHTQSNVDSVTHPKETNV